MRALLLLCFLSLWPMAAWAQTATPSLGATPSVQVAIATPSIDPLLLAPEAVVPRPKTLTILHTNDSFGLFDPLKLDPYTNQARTVGGAVRMAAMMGRERRGGAPVLLLSAGNVLGPNPLAAASQGRSTVQLMNQLGYDAWLPSNYDFSYGLDALVDRIGEASASAVLTNVHWAWNGLPLAKPYAVFQRGGVRIAVMGLVDPAVGPYVDFADRPRIEIDPPLAAAARWVPIIRREATPDLIIAMTHLSLDQEMPLLTRDSGIDLVVGGFVTTDPSAIAVHEVVGIDAKRALHGGSFGTAVGKARLTLEPGPAGDYRLARIEPELVRLDEATFPYQAAQRQAPAIARFVAATTAQEAQDWTREHGDLANVANDLNSTEARTLVSEIMRLTAKTELAALPATFFHNEQLFGPVWSAKYLYYAMPWEDALCVVEVPGDRIQSLYDRVTGSPPRAFLAGLSRKDSQLQVNGRPLDPKMTYSLATTYPATLGLNEGFDDLKDLTPRFLTISARRAVIRYFREQTKLGRAVSLSGFPDYHDMPFWKSSLQVITDLQRHAVDPAGNRYPDLAWKSDKSGMSWGGDATYKLGTRWGANELANLLEVSYHSDQLSDGNSQTSSDKIQLISDYRSNMLSSLVKPYATLTLTTRFVNDPGPPFFLGQIGTGFSHQIPVGLEVREGVEYRRHLFDPSQPDKTGGTLEFILNQKLGWFRLSTDLKLFATPNLTADGVLLDDESMLSLPLTESTALTYHVNLYRNTLYQDWATRHLLGLSFQLNRPWLF